MREMKDSGVEWIGETPESWGVIRFKYLHNGLNTGEAIDKAYWSEDENSRVFYTAGLVPIRTDYTEFPLWKYTTANDLLLARNGTPYVYFPEVGACYTDHIIRASMKAGICKKFVQYCLQCSIAAAVVETVSIPTWSASLWNKQELAWPTIEEQIIIVEVLDKKCAQVEALIANVQAQIEKLKAYKQSVITEVVTKGLDPTVPMKDSGVEWIGEMPEHWRIMPSKFLFANCDERRRDDDVQLTASQKYGMISQEEYMLRENARIVLADKGLENWKHVEPFDFVISLRSFQGGLEMSEVTGCATWHYIVLRAQEEIHPYYYKWLFKSSMYITALQKTCNYIRDGQDLRYSNFVKVPLCVPTLDEQREIADFLDKKCSQIDRLIALKQSKIEKLEQYKKSLIYEYVTGKKEVS